MIFVDTGYLFALLNRRDQLHQRAVAWQKALAEPLVTTEYVLWELVNGLSDIRSRGKAHAALDDIRSTEEWSVIAASADLFERGIQLHYQRPDKEWSLTDCISFVAMRDRSIQRSLTADHHFEQAGLEALLQRDPP